MNKNEIDATEKVEIPKQQIVVLLNAVRQIRTGFLMCAPRFAAGSRGEAMVSVANAMGGTLDELERQMSAAKPKEPSPEK